MPGEIMTTMLQLNPQIFVHTPLGEGMAFIVIDYGLFVNSCWVIRLSNGEVKHFDSNDIRIYGNPTYDLPLNPDIPTNWRQ